jgi:hypothetical protein
VTLSIPRDLARLTVPERPVAQITQMHVIQSWFGELERLVSRR